MVFTNKNEAFVHEIFSIIDFLMSQDRDLSTVSIERCGVPVCNTVPSPDTS